MPTGGDGTKVTVEVEGRRLTLSNLSKVLYPAVEDDDPVAPDPAKYGFIGLLAGFVVGLLYSFLLEASRLRVYTSQQLSDLTGIPVSGTIRALQPSCRPCERPLRSICDAIQVTSRESMKRCV